MQRASPLSEEFATNDDVEVLHEFEPLFRSTMRERFDILFVCVTLFISRIIFDLMANTIFVKVLVVESSSTFSASQKLMGALLKILELVFLVIASFIFIQAVNREAK
jgi:hypothetical protein